MLAMRMLALKALGPLTLALVAGSAVEGRAVAVQEPAVEPAVLSAALERAVESGAPAYHLRVDCPGASGVRSLELFPSGVAIWDLETQVVLPVEPRLGLLQQLRESGFVDLRPQYGGRQTAGVGAGEGAVRVICRIDLEIEGLRRSAVQLAEGEQSAELLRLANALLDRVAPLGGAGVRPGDLAQGVGMLARGELRPPGFELRFFELAADRASGSILRVTGDELSVQPYAPGREVGAATAIELGGERFGELARALVDSGFWDLPVNLWSDDQIEIEVRVLDHRRTVYARTFSRLSPDALGEAQQRFDRLVEHLRTVRGLGQ
jgi:hypothetical protein